MIKGIDISVYHLKKLRKAELNSWLSVELSEQKKIPCLKVGCYYYTLAKNVAEAKGEADVFLNCIRGKQFEYPIYFDIEDPSLQNFGKQTLTDIVLTWCGKV